MRKALTAVRGNLLRQLTAGACATGLGMTNAAVDLAALRECAGDVEARPLQGDAEKVAFRVLPGICDILP